MKGEPPDFRSRCLPPCDLTQMETAHAPPCRSSCSHRCPPAVSPLLSLIINAAATMTGIAAASFFSNACRFGGCGLHFDSLAELIVHIEDNHIGKSRQGTSRLQWPRIAASISGYASELASYFLRPDNPVARCGGC